MRIDIVTPSRTQPQQSAYLSRMIASVARQRLPDPVEFRILVALDPAAPEPELVKPAALADVRFVHADTAGQAAALNAALSLADSDLVAFLEDDDSWDQDFCQVALAAMAGAKADMHTSNQVVLDRQGRFRGISDFPTPSSWLLRTEAISRVGLMDTQYRYHLDHDWLGRARQLELRRVHAVEQTAPRSFPLLRDFRPVLARIVLSGSMLFPIKRPLPLIKRFENDHSGMMQISKGGPAHERSTFEKARLRDVYGQLPF